MEVLSGVGICVFGGIGAMLRYVVDAVIKAKWKAPFPLSTFAINVFAGLLAGISLGLFNVSLIADTQRLLMVVGFCGGFSTFSTLTNEAMSLLTKHDFKTAALYIALSAFVPIAFAMLGFVIITSV